jgi:hypothetical protein
MFFQVRALILAISATLMPWSVAADTMKLAKKTDKWPKKVLLFMNLSGRSLQMTSEEPIRRVLDATGKVVLDLDPAKTGTQGSVESEYKNSQVVSVWWWFSSKRTSVSVGPQSRGTATITLEGDSGKKESFEIIVLTSALATQPGATLRLQSTSKKPIKQMEIENEKIVSGKLDPADPTRAVIKGLAQGFSTIRLNTGSDDPEFLEVVVHPEKITEDKVLILEAGLRYSLRMSSRKIIAMVRNSDDNVLEVRSVRDNPEWITFTTHKAGFTRLELGAEDNSRETFAVIVVDPKK